jgi:hypothetical protein
MSTGWNREVMGVMKRNLLLMLGVGCLLLANDEVPRRLHVTKTEHADLAAAGTVRLKEFNGGTHR